MFRKRYLVPFLIAVVFALAACGGGGGSKKGSTNPTNPTPPASTPPPADTSPVAQEFSLSGTLAGLSYGQLRLSLNEEVLALNQNGAFSFSQKIKSNEAYSISILEHPQNPNIVCTLVNGDGIVRTENITNIQIQCPSVTGLAVSTERASLPKDGELALTVTANFNNGTSQVVTPWSTLNVGDSSILSLSGHRVIGVQAGTSHVTAQFAGQSQQRQLTVNDITISSLSINPSLATLSVGGSFTPKVTAIYSNGSQYDITSQVALSSGDSAILEVTGGNVVTALAAGTTTLTATWQGVSRSSTVIVSSATLLEIDVTPAVLDLAVNAEISYRATGLYSDGSFRDITSQVTWSSLDPAVATVTTNGKVRGVTVGITDIRAQSGSVFGAGTLRVQNKTLESISIIGPSSLPLGFKGSYSVMGQFSDGSSENLNSQAKWSFSNANIASLAKRSDETLEVIPESAGSGDLIVVVGTLSVTRTLSIANDSLTSIEVRPGSLLIAKGMSIKFRALGRFNSGLELDITENITWTSSNTSHAEIISGGPESGQMTNKVTGTSWVNFNIIAASSGITSTQQITVTPATLTSLYLNKSSVQLEPFTKTRLKAFGQFSDGGAVELTDVVRWRTNDSNVLRASNAFGFSGEISGVQSGSAQVTAEFGALSTQLSVNVTSGASSSVDQGVGLLGAYYSGMAFNTFAGNRIDTTVNFNLGTGTAPLGVGDRYSVRWTGFVRAPASGSFTFYMRSDDGVRVYFDNAQVVNRWNDHAVMEDAFTRTLVAGQYYPITIEFYENGGHSTATLEWAGPGITRQIVPRTALFLP
ncbi:MAG: PA14 domain-containing protein [Bdellovibrionia bacterium]